MVVIVIVITTILAAKEDTDLQVVQSELAGGLLVELQGDLQLVQLLPQTGKLLEVIIRHLQQLPKGGCIGEVIETKWRTALDSIL